MNLTGQSKERLLTGVYCDYETISGSTGKDVFQSIEIFIISVFKSYKNWGIVIKIT